MASGTIKSIANKPSLKARVDASFPYTPTKNGMITTRFTHSSSGVVTLRQAAGVATSTYNTAGNPSELALVVGKGYGEVTLEGNPSAISWVRFVEFE